VTCTNELLLPRPADWFAWPSTPHWPACSQCTCNIQSSRSCSVQCANSCMPADHVQPISALHCRCCSWLRPLAHLSRLLLFNPFPAIALVGHLLLHVVLPALYRRRCSGLRPLARLSRLLLLLFDPVHAIHLSSLFLVTFGCMHVVLPALHCRRNSWLRPLEHLSGLLVDPVHAVARFVTFCCMLCFLHCTAGVAADCGPWRT
jgi:hypothetical protein